MLHVFHSLPYADASADTYLKYPHRSTLFSRNLFISGKPLTSRYSQPTSCCLYLHQIRRFALYKTKHALGNTKSLMGIFDHEEVKSTLSTLLEQHSLPSNSNTLLIQLMGAYGAYAERFRPLGPELNGITLIAN
jgi:hypothetical protein